MYGLKGAGVCSEQNLPLRNEVPSHEFLSSMVYFSTYNGILPDRLLDLEEEKFALATQCSSSRESYISFVQAYLGKGIFNESIVLPRLEGMRSKERSKLETRVAEPCFEINESELIE